MRLEHDVPCKVRVWPWLDDATGRAYCGRCLDAGFGRQDHPDSAEKWAWRALDLPDVESGCDGCGLPVSDWPSVEIEARGTVEHVTCRIF